MLRFSPDVSRPLFLLMSLYTLIFNTLARTALDIGLDVGYKHFILRVVTAQQQN